MSNRTVVGAVPALEPDREFTVPAAPTPVAPTPAGGAPVVSAPPAPTARAPADTGRRSLTARHPAVSGTRRRPRWVRWLVIALGVAAVLVAVVLAWMPEPVVVELEEATVGPLEVTVDEDGRTRVIDRYVVSAPVAGTVGRVELRAGDLVRRGDVVARIAQVASPLLDPRSRAEAEGRVSAAQASVRQAATLVTRARAAHEFAVREAGRQRALLSEGAAAPLAVEQAELAERMRAEEMTSAEFGHRVAESELRVARSALLGLDRPASARAEHLEIRSPVGGRVLRVAQESEGPVQAGTPVLEVGDPRALEVVVDVLTADAVDIRPGTPVRIERWGGDSALRAHVHRVEPSAFTRLSSLGIEEQRVNVVIDLEDPWERRAALGDGYRVEARIVVWRADSVLQMPAGAVFRSGGGWAAYVVDGGRARLRALQIGRRNAARVQVLGGLGAGERVIVYPGDDVADGIRIEAR